MFISASTESITVSGPWERADPELVAKIAAYPVANIGDALGRTGLMGSAIRGVWTGAACHGSILPINTREGDNLAIHRALDEAQPGDVLVVNGFADVNRAVFGDLLAEICLARGVTGVVIDGAVRDAEAIGAIGLAAFARAVTPAGPSKMGPGTVGEPVACGNLVCNPGDAIVADSDGIAVIPRARLAQVLAKLVEIDAMEAALREQIIQTRKNSATAPELAAATS
jgi:regulator of RNase E activity RraA